MSTSPIASRDLVAESSDGKRFKVTLFIGHPRPGEHDSWVCASGVEGLSETPKDSHGTDSLQALLLSIQTARSQLSRFVKGGGKLYWPGDEASGAIPVAELFGDGA